MYDLAPVPVEPADAEHGAPVLNYQTPPPLTPAGRKARADAPGYDPLVGFWLRDFYGPGLLLLVGSLITFGQAIHVSQTVAAGLLLAGVQMMVMAVVVASAMLLTGRLADLNWGSPFSAALKLGALATLPPAVALLLLGSESCAMILALPIICPLLWGLLYRQLFSVGFSECAWCAAATCMLAAISLAGINGLFGSVLFHGLF